MTASSNLNAQNLREVKLKTNNENVTLEQALKHIEQNTTFKFTFNRETIPLDKRVHFVEGETSLYALLYNLAKYYGLTFHRISRQIVVRKADETEKYNVTDEESNTIEG